MSVCIIHQLLEPQGSTASCHDHDIVHDTMQRPFATQPSMQVLMCTSRPDDPQSLLVHCLCDCMVAIAASQHLSDFRRQFGAGRAHGRREGREGEALYGGGKGHHADLLRDVQPDGDRCQKFRSPCNEMLVAHALSDTRSRSGDTASCNSQPAAQHQAAGN